MHVALREMPVFGNQRSLPIVEVGICLGEMTFGEVFYALNAYPECYKQYAEEQYLS